MTTAVDHYLSIQKEHALPGRGIAWIDDLRERGIDEFKANGFPTIRDEDWRYTNTRQIQKQPFTPVDTPIDSTLRERFAQCLLQGLNSHRIVFIDGRYSAALTGEAPLPKGVNVQSLAAAIQSGSVHVQKLLGSCTPLQKNGFSALNTAFVEDGIYLRVDDDCMVERPIEIVFFNTERGGQLIQPRNLLVFGERSQAKVIERYISLTDIPYFTNSITEMIVHRSAITEHTKLQEESNKAFHVGGVFVRLSADAQMVSNNVALGSLIARTDLSVTLTAEGGECYLNGVYLANGRQHVDNFTQVDHQQPNCKSDEFYKGVLDNRARAVFRGRVIVHQDAQYTDAEQQNRNLLLSDDAEIDTKPQLEIYADDVKCSHGATVGQLDEDAMYYLRTRAIDAPTARSLLTYAFAGDVISRFSLKPIRRHVENVLSKKLFGVDRLEDLV
ncbi:MAG: Fe-S cluster assembly protein SufD [Arenicellales bacterium]|nr:Fe-S cluster assembly protein SufD [Arenicellales bacterium]